MKFGYIRVSRDKQTTALQPEFQKMLEMARAGDVIMVWRLDRVGISLKHLIETVTLLGERGIEVRSLRENLDTMPLSGKLMFHIMAALAEFERDVIRERAFAGLEAARARGRKGGRRRRLSGFLPTSSNKRKDSLLLGRIRLRRLWHQPALRVATRFIIMWSTGSRKRKGGDN